MNVENLTNEDLEYIKSRQKFFEDFRKEYSRLHSYCPKCGDKHSVQTLVGYILIEDKLEEYKDGNICICSKCGDRHSVHDRISKEQIATI